MIYPVKISRPDDTGALCHVRTLSSEEAAGHFWESCQFADNINRNPSKLPTATCSRCEAVYNAPKTFKTDKCYDCRRVAQVEKKKQDKLDRIEAKPQKYCIVCKEAIPKESVHTVLCHNPVCHRKRKLAKANEYNAIKRAKQLEARRLRDERD